MDGPGAGTRFKHEVVMATHNDDQTHNPLLHTALFKQVSVQQAEELLPHMHSAMVNKGDTIFREGDTDHRMYVIEQGRVKLIRQSADNRVQLLSIHTRGEVLENVGDFRLLDRRCIEALRQMRETERYTKGMFSWIGFRKKEIPFEVQQRAAGKSSWSYAELVRLAIEGITSYTTAPLRLATWTGLLCALGAFLYMCFFFVKTLVVGDDVQGFPTLIIVILFLGGVQLVSLGIIGEYLGRIFHETKRRPPYLVREVEGAREENTAAN